MFIYGPSRTIDGLNDHFAEDLAHAKRVKKEEWQLAKWMDESQRKNQWFICPDSLIVENKRIVKQ